MEINDQKEYVNGSVIRFAKMASDFRIDETSELYFKAFVMSESAQKVSVELYFDFSAYNIPQLDPTALEIDLACLKF